MSRIYSKETDIQKMGPCLLSSWFIKQTEFFCGIVRALTTESWDSNGRKRGVRKESWDLEWIKWVDLGWNWSDLNANRVPGL